MGADTAVFTLSDFDRAYGGSIDGMGARSLDDARFSMTVSDGCTLSQNSTPTRRAAVRKASDSLAGSEAYSGRKASRYTLSDAVATEGDATPVILTLVVPSDESFGSADTVSWYRSREMPPSEASISSMVGDMDFVTVLILAMTGSQAFSADASCVRAVLPLISDSFELYDTFIPSSMFGIGPSSADVTTEEAFALVNMRPMGQTFANVLLEGGLSSIVFSGREWRAADGNAGIWTREGRSDAGAWMRDSTARTRWTQAPSILEVRKEELVQ